MKFGFILNISALPLVKPKLLNQCHSVALNIHKIKLHFPCLMMMMIMINVYVWKLKSTIRLLHYRVSH